MSAQGGMGEAEGGWRTGVRTGATLALATAALGVSFGAYATLAGWPPVASILMSALVLSGSAQFAFVTATAGGGAILVGLGAAALMNLRFVPMAAAAARSLRGGRVRRAFEGQTVVDGSWVAAQRADGTTDRELMIGATLVQWPAWIAGTAAGALLVPSADLLYRLGLDVVFPCFFLLLLLESLRSRPDHRWVALLAALIAGLALFAVPAGVALLLSAGASAIVLVPRRRPGRREE
jgi:predicted branched-subunit amino acid permease